MRSREFIAPNGEKRTFWFRDGTNDESTIIACFEEDHYKILDEKFEKGDVVIDLGAHIGGVSCLLATIPGIKIISVEALPENLELLKKNLMQAGGAGTEGVVYENAIWSRSHEMIDICYGDDSESGKVHRFIGTMGQGTDQQDSCGVETISLLSIFRKENIKKCKLLKADIEGAEEEVIRNTPKHVLKRIEKIKGEYHGGDYRVLLEGVKDIFEDISENKDNEMVLCDFEWRKR